MGGAEVRRPTYQMMLDANRGLSTALATAKAEIDCLREQVAKLQSEAVKSAKTWLAMQETSEKGWRAEVVGLEEQVAKLRNSVAEALYIYDFVLHEKAAEWPDGWAKAARALLTETKEKP